MIRAAWIVLAVSCGQAAPTPLAEPTSAAVCARAVDCGAFDDAAACVACIERSGIAPQWEARLRELYGDPLPSLDAAPCSLLVQAARDVNLAACVAGKWYGER